MFLISIALFYGISIVLNLTLSYPFNKITNSISKNFMERVSKKMYVKVNKLPAIAFEEYGVGEFTNRLLQDPERVLSLLSKMPDILSEIIAIVLVFWLTITTNVVLTIEVILLIIAAFVYSKYFFPILKKSNEDYKNESDKYVKRLTQNITGIRDIIALHLAPIINKITFKNIDAIAKDNQEISANEFKYYTNIDIIYCIFQFIIMITCGYFFFKDMMSFTVFVMLESYVWRVGECVQGLTNFGANYNKIIVSLKRMDEILNNTLYNDVLYGVVDLKNNPGNIKFDNVYFKYRNNENYILKGLSLDIEPHKKIAIVGKSGQGKSTIFNLLLRYFDANEGNVFIDDVNIKDLTEESLQNNISVIRQSPYLFNETIFENFKYIKDNVTLGGVRTVCKEAYIDDYIMSLPNKYDTIIGEGGINLSGGQKQRIVIARTLLKNTKIILFDEATSALDNESQEYIKKTIDGLVKKHTIIIIAHRLSTIIDADKICVINDGTLVAMGTHKELLNSNEIYKNLYSPEVINIDTF